MSENKIFGRFIKAQSEFPSIAKDKKAKAFKSGGSYNYTDISAILEIVEPILNKHGLALMQKTASTVDSVTVETVLISEEGETISSGGFTVSTTGLLQKGVQAHGSAITYARRYSIASFLGLAYGTPDDDGQEATRHHWESKTARKTTPVKSVGEEGTAEENETYKTLKGLVDNADSQNALAEVTATMKLNPKLTQRQLQEIRRAWSRKSKTFEDNEPYDDYGLQEIQHEDAGDRI